MLVPLIRRSTLAVHVLALVDVDAGGTLVVGRPGISSSAGGIVVVDRPLARGNPHGGDASLAASGDP